MVIDENYFSDVKYHFKKIFLTILMVLCLSSFLLASDGIQSNITEKMTLLIFQLSIIIFAAWLGGYIFKKIKIPSVLGEIFSGIFIGPYCLGKLPFLGFPSGLFPVASATFPISPELYAFGTLASIILLFMSGLETDLKTFLRYSFAGTIIGVSGIILSFILGDFVGIIFGRVFLNINYKFSDIMPLFLGATCTATSVGITARILSEKKKMDSPEGVTTIAAAVVDDVIGIIILAIIIGIAKSGHIEWKQVSFIGLKAVGIWILFTALGLIFAPKIAKFLKFFKDKTSITIMSLVLTMLLSGIFEKSGLAMIIGAYIMGLSLSKTDLSLTIQENLTSLEKFFIPIFFCIMGMMVDISQMASLHILMFGGFYLLFAVLGKVIGCMSPAFFLNFNFIGALRIGVGMIPRGEVALIVVSIGLANGILNQEVFSIAIIMTFLTTLITPPILLKLFDIEKIGNKKNKEILNVKKIEIIYQFPNHEEEYITFKVLEEFEKEGYFVHNLSSGNLKLYRFFKDEYNISLKIVSTELENEKFNYSFMFECQEKDKAFVNTIFYEVIADLERFTQNLKSLTNKDKEEIVEQIFNSDDKDFCHINIMKNFLLPNAISIDLKSENKQEILAELLDILIDTNQVQKENRKEILDELIEREKIMSTGMQKNLAFPHIRTNYVKKLVFGIGIKKAGIDFKSLDNIPSKVFIITLAPNDSHTSYLNFIAETTKLLAHIDIDNLINSKTKKEVYEKLVNPIYISKNNI
ncbi:MAG: cation:proton antiporter [Elusimicrobiota bacterium]|jgi:Kef-type K+ transport system membrane component KefB/mannitol/fructose-specific phosphotransferase system IIA component (Ntr-type)|nr:cation:proton antiporter [Elusimicrobiota bacterium]